MELNLIRFFRLCALINFWQLKLQTGAPDANFPFFFFFYIPLSDGIVPPDDERNGFLLNNRASSTMSWRKTGPTQFNSRSRAASAVPGTESESSSSPIMMTNLPYNQQKKEQVPTPFDWIIGKEEEATVGDEYRQKKSTRRRRSASRSNNNLTVRAFHREDDQDGLVEKGTIKKKFHKPNGEGDAVEFLGDDLTAMSAATTMTRKRSREIMCEDGEIVDRESGVVKEVVGRKGWLMDNYDRTGVGDEEKCTKGGRTVNIEKLPKLPQQQWHPRGNWRNRGYSPYGNNQKTETGYDCWRSSGGGLTLKGRCGGGDDEANNNKTFKRPIEGKRVVMCVAGWLVSVS